MLNEGLSAWERWIHADSNLNPIVKVAMAHYQFEALHPFTDGNGRIGRLVAILQLIEADLLPGPLINLSPYFEKRAEEYRYRLGTVSTDGDIDGWVRFFCRALASQAAEAGDRIRQLLEWRDTTVADLRSMRHKGTTITIVESLIQYPSFTVKFMADRLGVSVPTSNAAVNRLTELGILEEVTGRRYNRSFRATEVMRIIFSQPGPPTASDQNAR